MSLNDCLEDIARTPDEDLHTEECMFCPTRIAVPAPHTYAVICAECKRKAYEFADKISAKRLHKTKHLALGLLHEIMAFVYMDDEIPEETVKAIEQFLLINKK